MKELPYISDKALFQGVSLALWLYLDKCWSLKAAVDKAAEKYSVKPKSSIEKMLRKVVPEELILDRMSFVRVKTKTGRPPCRDSGVRVQKMIKIAKDANQHIIDITKR